MRVTWRGRHAELPALVRQPMLPAPGFVMRLEQKYEQGGLDVQYRSRIQNRCGLDRRGGHIG
jgi:hypothetical protein